MSNSFGKPVETFICYTSYDMLWYEQLVEHLSGLEEQQVLELKGSREIGLRAEWRQESDPGMSSARLVLILLSMDLLASGYLDDGEMQLALERYERGECQIVVILLRPVSGYTPLLRRLPLLHDQTKKTFVEKGPLSSRDNVDEALAEITQEIALICQKLHVPGKLSGIPEAITVSEKPHIPGKLSSMSEATTVPERSPRESEETTSFPKLLSDRVEAIPPILLHLTSESTMIKKSIKKTSNKVFVCYSHEDAVWLKRLQVHLKPIERKGDLELWDDTKIPPGAKRRDDIQRAIETSAAVVLLISADFLASEFISTFELPRILARAEAGGTTILPLIVGPCMFRESELEIFQSINSAERSLILMNRAEQEQTLTTLARAINNLGGPKK